MGLYSLALAHLVWEAVVSLTFIFHFYLVEKIHDPLDSHGEIKWHSYYAVLWNIQNEVQRWVALIHIF